MINIAHLYYDLLNLYGESGNVKALKKELENQGIKVSINYLTISDKLDFSKYDLVYIGAGTENNQILVINHLMKYQDEINKAINDNKIFLVTGNAIDLFGKYILDKNNKKIETINIFDYYTQQEKTRIVDECVMKCSFIDKPIIGFQNQGSIIKDNQSPMFDVIKGYSKEIKEGIHYKNFYGTYMLGPILVRNPELLKYMIKLIIKTKKKNHKFKSFDLKLNTEAYNNFVNTYYQDII